MYLFSRLFYYWCVLWLLSPFMITAQSMIEPDSLPHYINKVEQMKDSLPDLAIKLAEKCLAVAQHPENKARLYAALTDIYNNRNEYEKLIAFGLRGLENTQSNKVKRRLYNAVGNAYASTKAYDLGIKYLKEGLVYAQKDRDTVGIAQTYNNLGAINEKRENWELALRYYLDALEICEQKHYIMGIKILSNNLGNVYLNYKKDYDKAREYYNKAIQITLKTESEAHTGFFLNNIANIHTAKGEYQEAIALRLRAVQLASQIGDKESFKNTYGRLAKDYAAIKDYKNAYQNLSFYHDSSAKIFGETQAQMIAEMQAKYDNHKKEKEIDLLNKENELQQHRLQQQTWVLLLTVLGALFMILVIYLLYRSNKSKKKNNQTLKLQNEAIKRQQMELQIKTQQTEELNAELNKSYEELSMTLELLNQQHRELEQSQQDLYHKNKDIMASIEYARTIQMALLPRKTDFQRLLPHSFIFNHPRDIVSGDFYYIAQLQDRRDKTEKIVLAVADCTGHGVPGALLTMIGMNLLNELIIHEGFSAPNVILRRLSKSMRNMLHQDTSESSDGMDIAIVTLLRKETQFTQLEYAGAMNPIYLVRTYHNEDKGTELVEMKADKVPVGGLFIEEDFSYTKHTVVLQEAQVAHTHLYLCSDGLQDQFGGERGKKFMVKRLRGLLLDIATQPISKQQSIVANTLQTWQGNEPQVDDMLLVGIKIQ